MRKIRYEKPSISVIVCDNSAILAGSTQLPYGNSKEGGFDMDWNEEDDGGAPSLSDDEEE